MTRELTSSLAKDVDSALTAQNFGVSPLDQYSVPPQSRKSPVGLLTLPGIPRKHFNQIIEATILEFAMNAGQVSRINVSAIKQYCPHITVDTISKVLASDEYHNVLVLRGVRSEDTDGLSGQQMRALAVMSDTSRTLSLERKLKNAGISWYEWQMWMHSPLFRAHHDRLAAKVFEQATAQIDLQVASGALDGKLEFIKYYNELTGRHDPARKAHQDVQMILNSVVEIITRNVKDSNTLAQISAELSAVVAKLG